MKNSDRPEFIAKPSQEFGSTASVRVDSRTVGEIGEAVAKAYLEWLGYEYLNSNWKFGRGEIDLIFCDRTEIVFVEVKTRIVRRFQNQMLLDSVDKQKSYQLERLALSYLHRRPVARAKAHRIDVVGVLLSADLRKVKKLEHIKAAVGQGRY